MQNIRIKHSRPAQSGFTLPEILIASVIGMTITAGAISMFASSVGLNSDNLSRIRLNQELQVIMDVMSRDIRRAGYWSDSNDTNALNNPFKTITVTKTIENEGEGNQVNKDCILFSYDAEEDGSIGDEDRFGFEAVGSAINMRIGNGACGTGVTNWEPISDTQAIKIMDLKIDLNRDTCKNLTNSDRGCGAGAIANDITNTMNVVTISLSAQLKSDASVTETFVKRIAVRNLSTDQI